MVESSRDRVVRSAKRRAVALAYRAYATLVVEHERVRREGRAKGREALCEPGEAAWRRLRFLAEVHGTERRAGKALGQFFRRHGHAVEEGEEEGKRKSKSKSKSTSKSTRRAVALGEWEGAVKAGVELVADVLVRHGAELPWGKGKPRVPRRREEFERVCRFLRDRDGEADELGSLAAILDAVDLSARPPRPAHRATFYRGRQALSIDGVRMPLPMGRELLFLELLAERRGRGELTPRHEHEIDWRNALEHLRRRIRKATGRDLLGAVVVSARGPAGGYRLVPGVRVRND